VDRLRWAGIRRYARHSIVDQAFRAAGYLAIQKIAKRYSYDAELDMASGLMFWEI